MAARICDCSIGRLTACPSNPLTAYAFRPILPLPPTWSLPLPAPNVTSVLASHAMSLGDDALASPIGVSLRYTMSSHGTLKNAQKAAKRFQTAFNTMRVRDRNLLQRRRGEATYDRLATTLSKYDALACIINDFDDGYEVQLIREEQLGVGVVVTDLATGEELQKYSSTANEHTRLSALLGGMLDKGAPYDNPFTPDDLISLKRIDPTVFDWLWTTKQIDLDGSRT